MHRPRRVKVGVGLWSVRWLVEWWWAVYWPEEVVVVPRRVVEDADAAKEEKTDANNTHRNIERKADG